MIPILNEKKYVEEIISSSTMPEKMTVNTMISYLTKYYYMESSSMSEVIEKVCIQMSKFNIDIRYYQEYKCKNRVEKIYKAITDEKLYLLKEYDNIPLYKSEYDKIITCNNDKEKKLLFTVYILARYTDRYGWVYNPRNEIFKLANISSTTKGYKEIIFNLLRSGYIKNTNKVDDVKIGVDLGDSSEDIVLKVSNISNLGNQFMAFIKDGYKLCECCGRLIKFTNNRQKYCKKCYEEINEADAKNRMRKYRET